MDVITSTPLLPVVLRLDLSDLLSVEPEASTSVSKFGTETRRTDTQ